VSWHALSVTLSLSKGDRVEALMIRWIATTTRWTFWHAGPWTQARKASAQRKSLVSFPQVRPQGL